MLLRLCVKGAFLPTQLATNWFQDYNPAMFFYNFWAREGDKTLHDSSYKVASTKRRYELRNHFFVKRSQYIRIKNPFHKHSEKAFVVLLNKTCYNSRLYGCASTSLLPGFEPTPLEGNVYLYRQSSSQLWHATKLYWEAWLGVSRDKILETNLDFST